ncbi:MAG: hypothetical protein JSS34_04910 [Proteobacteria bacterium]|nr:hypothetical protein [Pseudomonadota bacterium]
MPWKLQNLIVRFLHALRKILELEALMAVTTTTNNDDVISKILGTSILDKKDAEYKRLDLLFAREKSRLTAEKEAQEEKERETPEEYQRVIAYHQRMSGLFSDVRTKDLINYKMLAQMEDYLLESKSLQPGQGKSKSPQPSEELSSWLEHLNSYITEKSSHLAILKQKKRDCEKDQMEKFDLSLVYNFESYPYSLSHLKLTPYCMQDSHPISKRLYYVKHAFLQEIERLEAEIFPLETEIPFLLNVQAYFQKIVRK